MNKVLKLALSKNKDDWKIARAIIKQFPGTRQALRRLMIYIGPRSRNNTCQEIHDLGNHSRIYSAVCYILYDSNSPPKYIWERWKKFESIEILTKDGPFYDDMLKALKKLQNE